MAAHRYWRLYNISKNNTNQYIGITDIEMAEAYSGANVCIGGTASANAFQGAGLEADKAFDGNPATLWQADTGGNYGNAYWIAYDFGAGVTRDIVEVRIRPNFGDKLRTFAFFRVQFSDDGLTWNDVWYICFDNNAYTVGTYQVFQKPGALAAACRYWALSALQNGAANNVFSAAELQLKDTAGGTNRALGAATLSTDFFNGSTTPNFGVDGDVNTFFGSTSQCLKSTIRFDLGAAYSIVEISIISRNDGNFNQAPFRQEIWKSADGVNFLYVAEFNVAAWTAAGQTRTFTVAQPVGVEVAQLFVVGIDREYESPIRYVRFGVGPAVMAVQGLYIQRSI
jgi:hypothetical protein